jgi:hypothetical protein
MKQISYKILQTCSSHAKVKTLYKQVCKYSNPYGREYLVAGLTMTANKATIIIIISVNSTFTIYKCQLKKFMYGCKILYEICILLVSMTQCHIISLR